MPACVIGRDDLDEFADTASSLVPPLGDYRSNLMASASVAPRVRRKSLAPERTKFVPCQSEFAEWVGPSPARACTIPTLNGVSIDAEDSSQPGGHCVGRPRVRRPLQQGREDRRQGS